MKGLTAWPSKQELAMKIHALETRQHLSESEIALVSQWARVESRVAEALCRFLFLEWSQSLHPKKMNEALKQQPWPASFGVIVEFVASRMKGPALKEFRAWSVIAMSGIEPENNALYFLGLRKIAGLEMQRDVDQSLRAYRKWGYFGRDHLTAVRGLRSRCQSDVRSRELMLTQYLGNKTRFTISDYMAAIGTPISQRQAQRDLKKMKRVRASGKTRGTVYSIRDR